MNYSHWQAERVVKPKRQEIPPRIPTQIDTTCAWFYQLHYAREKKIGSL
ncbi:MAG TPA: hypothetical protein VND80_06405 [Steroidobacteraceae bacterium]|nr:hypothetical protein [Steroidobacteraceae bacterium]